MSPTTVLVVEDNTTLRTLLSATLERQGYQVLSVATAEAALKHMQARTIDLVISDDRLPSLSGTALARRLRQLRPELKFLLITGDPDTPWQGPLLTKPFTLTDLHQQ